MTKKEYLAEIQMLSLALADDWGAVRKIAMTMQLDALQHFAAVCKRLYYRCGDIEKQSEGISRCPECGCDVAIMGHAENCPLL